MLLYLRIALGADGNTVRYFVKHGLKRLTFLCILAAVSIQKPIHPFDYD